MGVQREDDSTVPHRPGGVRARCDMAGIPVDRLPAFQLFRFRGPFLAEEGGQQYIDPQLQEFAFPILSDGLPEMARPEVSAIGDGGLFVLLPLFIVLTMASQALAY